MKNGILIAIAVFGVSVIGAAVAAAAYFKHKQSMIFDEYEEELAGDMNYYQAPAKPNIVEAATAAQDAEDAQGAEAKDVMTEDEASEIDFASDEDDTDDVESIDLKNDRKQNWQELVGRTAIVVMSWDLGANIHDMSVFKAV